MTSSDQNSVAATRHETNQAWWQVLPFAIFGLAVILLLAGVVIQSFWPDAMAGHSLSLGLILLSVCATALIGGLVVMTGHYMTIGLGVVVIALIPMVWVVFGLGAIGPAGGGIVSAQCEGAPWAAGRRNLAVNGLDEAVDFTASVPGNTVAYYRFRLTEAAVIRLEAANGDPALLLSSENGLELQTNDDAGGTLGAQIEADLAEGTYCVGVRSVGSPVPYTVRIGLQSHAPLITVPFQACKDSALVNLQSEAAVNFQIREDEHKALRVTIRDGIVLEGKSSAVDPMLTLYTFDGDELASDDDGGMQTNALLSLSPSEIADGDYCLLVNSVGGSGPLSVHAWDFDIEMENLRQAARGERVPDVDSELVHHLGVINSAIAEDVEVAGESGGEGVRWYYFELADNALVTIDLLEGQRGDPILALYMPNGRGIAQNDDSGDGRDAQISAPLSAGSYLVSAGSYDLTPFFGRLKIQIEDIQ